MILTTAATKGGTGKTTTAAALAQAAAHEGARVLCVDLDPQGNLSYVLGAETDRPGAYHLITGAAGPGEAIQATEQGIDAISAAPDLATIKTTAGSAKRLARALAPVKESYALIVIDTPPQMGEGLYNAIWAADRLIIPLEADINALAGFYQVLDIARRLRRADPLQAAGVLVTRYDGRPKINRHLLGQIQGAGEAAGAPLLGTIRAGIAVREAQALQVSLYDYAPKSKPAKDYMSLYDKLMQ